MLGLCFGGSLTYKEGCSRVNCLISCFSWGVWVAGKMFNSVVFLGVSLAVIWFNGSGGGVWCFWGNLGAVFFCLFLVVPGVAGKILMF